MSRLNKNLKTFLESQKYQKIFIKAIQDKRIKMPFKRLALIIKYFL